MSNNKLCPILNAKILAQSIEDVPVIIQFKDNNEDLFNDVSSVSSKMKADLPIIHGLAVNMSTDIVYRLSTSPDVDFISFDSNVYALLDIANATMESYFPHDKGYDGNGIGVAVIDTGVAPHADLVKPKNRLISFKDYVKGKTDPYDDNGHGTHVAGIIAGNGYSSKGKYVGIAPKTNIISLKALDENGGGSTSDIIAALSYCIENKERYNIKIVNLSLGPANNKPEKDPLVKAVEKCVEAGLVVVTAAGNSGPNEKTILSPGVSRKVITVGAVDDKRTIDTSDDTIAKFSSRGPTIQGIQKPDLVAPGVNINSLSNTKLDSYTSLSGTSMATPLISGSLALLFNRYGDELTPEDYKLKLVESCEQLNEPIQGQGAGMLNLKLLFNAEPNMVKSLSNSLFDDDFIETLIMLLIIFFLLDSRI